MTTHTARLEGAALVAILLVVATFAGAASFTHVKDWTLANSLPGTGEWFGWANAVISELLPTAAALDIRRRRRTGQPIAYPAAVLAGAVALSLAAQLAVAKSGPSGWLLSAVPALAFLALTKLVLTTNPPQPAQTVAAPPVAVDDDQGETHARPTALVPLRPDAFTRANDDRLVSR
ncbi:DUF2637 domain-containing protein [Asanoa siamensis]|uniref:DUF2637 domain-containing protein n=1 Tax=Asanoa siamensis TaxID=926357 RepID=A0ABQ4CVK4_9ACTN|nr:DUF2637 domain-containing protein [Asanoa siamensis]GIF75309.1 hypothetical protein Asi02nite_48270 [Asanoa siamensis]